MLLILKHPCKKSQGVNKIFENIEQAQHITVEFMIYVDTKYWVSTIR